jgi:hypothetical protein
MMFVLRLPIPIIHEHCISVSIFLIHGYAAPNSPFYEYCILTIFPFHENYTQLPFFWTLDSSDFPFFMDLMLQLYFPLFTSFVFCCPFSFMLYSAVLYCNVCTWRWHKFCKTCLEGWY